MAFDRPVWLGDDEDTRRAPPPGGGRLSRDPFADPLNIRGSGESGAPRAVRPTEPTTREVSHAPEPTVEREAAEEEPFNFFRWAAEATGMEYCCAMRGPGGDKDKDMAKPQSVFPEPGAPDAPHAPRGVGAPMSVERSTSSRMFCAATEPGHHAEQEDIVTPSADEFGQGRRQPQREQRAAAPPALPPRWEWPKWCLDFKTPSIEVYVLDDDTGRGSWVHAEPQSRVVDRAGRDSFLCAEYEWDEDFFQEDFGPDKVRRRGSRETVQELLARQGGSELDETRVAPGRGRGGR